ncbi:MAG: NAD(P)-binding domain-containing protein [Pseudomonas sp.]|uniref:flavin-containing monooxygenase n=1 Tax=Pseudomonas sp. TaxID=306 RepID=UPI003391E4E7
MNKYTYHSVLIIGAGQAGLAMGRHLQRQGVDSLILEAGEHPGGNWRHYYDSLRLFSPAGYSALPDRAFAGDAQRYPRRDEVVAYLEDYAAHFQLPIRLNTPIERVTRDGAGFQLHSSDGRNFACAALVIATGAFNQPHTPAIAGLQDYTGQRLHSRDYRNTQGFEGRRVVVVGAANSAVQIAHELSAVAQVTLASREPVRFARQRLLGRDIHAWLRWSGLDRSRWLKDQGTPVLDDGTYQRALREGRLAQRPMFKAINPDGVIWADGEHEAVDTLLFATGYRPNLGFLAGLPLHDAQGRLLQRNGRASQVPGLFFVGLPGQRNLASATLRGVGADAAHLLPALRRHLAVSHNHAAAIPA